MRSYLALPLSMLCVSGYVDAAPREVEIRWDFTQASPNQLVVCVDGARTGDPLLSCKAKAAGTAAAPGSYSFVLKPDDRVTLVVVYDESTATTDGAGDVGYAIAGTNLDTKDLEALEGLFGVSAAKSGQGTKGPRSSEFRPTPVVRIKPVTDQLIAGGKLTVTFTLKTLDNGKEVLHETSGAVVFNVEARAPRLTVSYGVGFSTAASPKVAIAKTNTLVAGPKSGQLVYQQVITLQDADTSLKPIQTFVTLANFELVGPIYATAGVQVDSKLFVSPIVGGTYRIAVGQRAGFNVTAGIQFSRETAIDPNSGFVVGQTVDPTSGLTAGDIPTVEKYHRRFALAFSMDF